MGIFREYFREAGFTDICVSDKGNYTEETINKFGSLDEIGDFLNSGYNRSLLTLFLAQKSKNSLTEGEVGYVNQRAYIDYKAVQSVVGTPEAATKLIDSFISKGIFYRGIILQCPRCREADWFGLGEIDQFFVCKRCWNKDHIQFKNWKEGAEPKWFYKLDEVIYQGIKNNMHVPLLTLAYLKKKSKRSFLYLPEIELRKDPDAKKLDCEIDICCIQDGRILLGECKNPPITKMAIDRLSEFSGKLLRPPDRLVFASFSGQTSPDIQAYAKKTLAPGYIFLNESDLVGEITTKS
jgi:hypothetical protein